MTNFIKFENKCLNNNCNDILGIDDSRAICLNCNLSYIISDTNNILEICLYDYISNRQISSVYFIYIEEYGLYIKPNMQNINLINEIVCDLNIKKFIDIQNIISNLYDLNKLAKKLIDLEIFQ